MTAPVYLELTHYGDILDAIDEIKTDLLEASELLETLHTIRSQENEELALIKSNLKGLKKRLARVDDDLLIA